MSILGIAEAVATAEEVFPGLKLTQQGRTVIATSLPKGWTRADLDSLMNVTLKLEKGYDGRVYIRMALSKDRQSTLPIDNPAT